jgi:phosphoglycolate phosphatase
MRALIFDLDGTLLDSLADIATAMNTALAEHGLAPYPFDAYRQFVGEGVEVLIERAVLEPALRPAVLHTYRDGYGEGLGGETRPYPGIRELLVELSALRVPMAVLSNKPDRPTQRLVASLLPGHFVAVAGAKANVPKKPDPRVALAIAAELGVAPADCGFVGDTATDMRTATAAGMVPIGVAWGFRSREELTTHGARWLLEHPAQLLPLGAWATATTATTATQGVR